MLSPTALSSEDRWLDLLQRAVPHGVMLEVGRQDNRFLGRARRYGQQIADQPVNIFGRLSERLREGQWPAGTFDAVMMRHIPEGSADPGELLRLAAHYCRVDGILVVRVDTDSREVPASAFTALRLQAFPTGAGYARRFATDYRLDSVSAVYPVMIHFVIPGISQIYPGYANGTRISAKKGADSFRVIRPPRACSVVPTSNSRHSGCSLLQDARGWQQEPWAIIK